jgi:hypothetical protein
VPIVPLDAIVNDRFHVVTNANTDAAAVVTEGDVANAVDDDDVHMPKLTTTTRQRRMTTALCRVLLLLSSTSNRVY